jgi:hypothetical protein
LKSQRNPPPLFLSLMLNWFVAGLKMFTCHFIFIVIFICICW